MPITTHDAVVSDYADTSYAPIFADLPDDWPVAVAYSPETGFCCALALNEGQSMEVCRENAKVELAQHIMDTAKARLADGRRQRAGRPTFDITADEAAASARAATGLGRSAPDGRLELLDGAPQVRSTPSDDL